MTRMKVIRESLKVIYNRQHTSDLGLSTNQLPDNLSQITLNEPPTPHTTLRDRQAHQQNSEAQRSAWRSPSDKKQTYEKTVK